MKKTLLAAVIAASFGVSAFAATLPTTNADGNPLSVVLSGTVDLAGQGAFVYNKTDDKVHDSSNELSYAGNDATLGLMVNSPFMKDFSAFTNVVVALGNQPKDDDFQPAAPLDGKVFQLQAKKIVVGVSSDSFGALTVGKQNSASDDVAYNGFGDFDIDPYADGASGQVNKFALKYASPDFNGVSFEASLAANNLKGTSNTMDSKTTGTSKFDLNNLSLGVQYANDALTVAATFDVQKKEAQDYASLGATLGAGYTFDAVTAFANLGFSNNDFAGAENTTKFGLQVGASLAATDADTVSAALQYGFTKVKDVDGNDYLVGAKLAGYHALNANATVYLFTAFNYESNTQKDNKASTTKVNYGAGLKYEF